MPRITIRTEQYELVYQAVNKKSLTKNRKIELYVRKRKWPIRKNDLLYIYWRNMITKRFERIGVMKCKKASSTSSLTGKDGGQWLTLTTSYDRKYYLNRRVKKAGLKLELEQTTKTISVPPHMVETAIGSDAVKELAGKFNYGVQYTIL